MLLVAAASTAPPSGGAGWRSPATRCQELAGTFRIAPALRPVVMDMCRQAPTFRRQVARIAGTSGFVVTVEQVVFPSTTSWRAQTDIARVGGELRSADVQ